MADNILSQDEIDALLNAVNTGEIKPEDQPKEPTEKKIVNYDFRRPEMLSKDQMRTLQMIHDSFARSYTNALSGYLRTIVEVNLLAVDQLTYGEFIMSLPDPTCISIIAAPPLEGLCIFEMNPVLIFTILDRLLGGKGACGKEIREFTEIEISVISDIVNQALVTLSQSWMHVEKLDFKTQKMETNPQFVQIIEQTETVVSITFEAKIGQSSGVISICFPYISLKPVVNKLSATQWVSSFARQTTAGENQIRELLQKANIQFTAILGTVKIRIKDLVGLRAGDVIRLDNKVNRELLGRVGGKDKFTGRVGLSGKQKSFQISGLAKPTF